MLSKVFSAENIKCEDKFTSCHIWANYGECDTDPEFMHTFCKKTCNVCENQGEYTSRNNFSFEKFDEICFLENYKNNVLISNDSQPFHLSFGKAFWDSCF